MDLIRPNPDGTVKRIFRCPCDSHFLILVNPIKETVTNKRGKIPGKG